MKKSEAIKAFLEANTWPDLANLYSDEMEVQVNAAQDGGERVDKFYKGRNWHEWTDGIQSWKSFRIPLNSMTVPEDNDTEIRFDLALHVEAIGMTGWNWKKRQSLWVAFDFDAIVGHSEKHIKKLTPKELEEIKAKVSGIEWVTLRQSTGGSGLHIYVFIDQNSIIENKDGLITNHNEHMAIGRAILSQLSAVAGFDFEAKVDVNSGNMWVWHRKMMKRNESGQAVKGENGLKLIKSGVPLTSIPKEWRDYLDVVTGKRRRTIPFFIKSADNPEQAFDEFEELSNQRPKVPLDKEHQRLLDWIQNNTPGGSWWRDDHWMLVTHTYTLKLAHQALSLKGPFDTLAEGTEFGNDKNSFAYPLSNGAWVVRRYSKGCAEAKTWDQDGQGYTRCFYNKLPDFKTACRLNGGIEKANGSYVFTQAFHAIEAAKMLGSDLTLPTKMHNRVATLKQHKDKRLIIDLDKENTDNSDGMTGYDGTGKKWTRIFDGKIDQINTPIDTLALDKIIRHIVNEGGHDEGWVVKADNASGWRDEPLEHVKLILKGHFQYKPHEVEQILGTGAIQPYQLINRPFDVEYPPGRLWNRKGAKLRFEPSQNIDNLSFPTWLKVLTHLGEGLDGYIQSNPWCQANNIKSGADYLSIWIAALFQQPYQRLPYLFFYSEEQNTGKSTFHEAISLLMDGDPPRGYMKINEALKATSSFNAELQNAILCVIEELDLNPKRQDAKISYNRIKELVTANTISIHEKRQTPMMVKNTTHFCQFSNDKGACPIFKNDNRITMLRVSPIDEIELIPKSKLLELLTKEAQDFLAFILRLEIPQSNDRLIVPVIETQDKQQVQSANLTLIEQFIAEECHLVDGEVILWSDFYIRFSSWLEPADMEKWTKRYTGLHLPDSIPKGRLIGNSQFHVGNISFSARSPESPIKPRLILKNETMIPIDNINSNGKVSHEQQNQGSL